jgi:hypothetical protein
LTTQNVPLVLTHKLFLLPQQRKTKKRKRRTNKIIKEEEGKKY